MKEGLLIKKCQDGDPHAQRAMYESYLPYVLTIVRRFGILYQDEADVIQEIFIEVFSSIDKYYSARGAFKFWLKSIAIHKILKIQRKQKSSKQTLLFDTEKIEHVASDNVVELIKNVDHKLLVQLIQDLPEGYRTVFNLFVIDGFSHKEISAQLGIDAATSRSQLTRAKQLLRKKLSATKKGNRYGLI
ncbi:MAG: sigma-70 family RNA polymerase sigma factor [Bacteroidota bacterium]